MQRKVEGAGPWGLVTRADGAGGGVPGPGWGQSLELCEPRADRVSRAQGRAEVGEARGPPAPYLVAG